MKGKDKCRMLREIRRQIAAQNDIEYVTEECRFKGECRGTCPKCEAELKYLEEQLDKRSSLGKRIALCGIAAGTAIAMSGCTLDDVSYGIGLAAKEIKNVVCPAPDVVEMGLIDISGEIEEMGDVAINIESDE